MTPSPSVKRWCRRGLLGSGSFGQVWLAEDLDSGKQFAVKSIRGSIQSELSIMQGLSSDNVLACYGSADGRTDLFLEYMDGGSLAGLVKTFGAGLPEGAVRHYVRGVVEGLAYLHEQGIVHCDIKGQNVLVSADGDSVKIADFGAAKRAGEVESAAASFRGTPLWMAPEVLNGVEQSFASDIWSLGITVCEMVLGYPLWRIDVSDSSSTSIGALLFKIACGTESPVLPEGISSEVADFISKCLNRDPKLRWTALQLLQHPFLCTSDSENRHGCSPAFSAQSTSPRSTLDFVSSQDDSIGEFSGDYNREIINVCDQWCFHGSCNNWITVRCTSDNNSRVLCNYDAGPANNLHIVKEANLDCLSFLLGARRRSHNNIGYVG